MRITMSYEIEEFELPKFIKDVGRWGRAVQVVTLNRNERAKDKREIYFRYIEDLLSKKGKLTTAEVHKHLSKTTSGSYRTVSRRLAELGSIGRVSCTVVNNEGLRYFWALKGREE